MRRGCINLNGMGGMGKTVLAKAAGRWQHERRRWQDGVWFIDLRNIDTIDAARTKTLNTLPLGPEAIVRGIKSNCNMVEVLSNSNVLIILDDVDLLLARDTEQCQGELIKFLEALLSCRRLQLVVTSRLAIPLAEVEPQEVLTIEPDFTRQIFRKYAPPELEWQENNTKDWEDLIAFLDGYPLAIKIAATHMKQRKISLPKLWQRLKAEPVQTLCATPYPENKTNSLTAALNLSYNVLPSGAKALFPHLAMFPGGLTAEMARFVFGENSVESLEILDLYSMAEKKNVTAPWRLPEPARYYAETKQFPNTMVDHATKGAEILLLLRRTTQSIFARRANFPRKLPARHICRTSKSQPFSQLGVRKRIQSGANLLQCENYRLIRHLLAVGNSRYRTPSESRSCLASSRT